MTPMKTLPLQPALADAGIEHGGLEARIGADEHDRIRLFDAGDAGVEEIAGAAALLAERRSVLAAIDIGDAKRGRKLLEREGLLSADKIADDDADALGRWSPLTFWAMRAKASGQVAARNLPISRI